MDKIILPAPAKINLFLDIKGKRNDGYHELSTIMQSISLCDIIEIEKNKSTIISLNCSDKTLPEDRGNLAYQAAELILDKADLSIGININIEKKIPVAAGLAGGSTDAAAVLKGVNKLFELGYSYNQLQQMAAVVGSDVPFCVRGGTVLAAGRGNKLHQLTDLTHTYLVLIKPPVTVSTAKIYQEFDKLKPKLDIPARKLINLIETETELDWDEGWGNVLESVTAGLVNEIKIIKDILYDFDVEFCLMSGSGPTVFAIIKDLEYGQYITENWPRSQDYVKLSSTIGQDFKELQ